MNQQLQHEDIHNKLVLMLKNKQMKLVNMSSSTQNRIKEDNRCLIRKMQIVVSLVISLCIINNSNVYSQSKNKIIEYFRSNSKQGLSIYRNQSGQQIKFYSVRFEEINENKITKAMKEIGKVNLGRDSKLVADVLTSTLLGGYDELRDHLIIDETDLQYVDKIQEATNALQLVYEYAYAHNLSPDKIDPYEIYSKHPRSATEINEYLKYIHPGDCDGFFTLACKTKKTRCENALKLGQVFVNSRNNPTNNSVNFIKADIIKFSTPTNPNRRSPVKTLKLYPEYRDFIKIQYRNWCESNTDALCPEYLEAFPEMWSDETIVKIMKRRAEVIERYNNSVQGLGSSSSSTSHSDTEKSSVDYENITAPSYTESVWKEDIGIYDGKYLKSTIKFSDGVEGILNKGNRSGKYFFEDIAANNKYYKDKQSAINALYVHQKYNKVIKKNETY